MERISDLYDARISSDYEPSARCDARFALSLVADADLAMKSWGSAFRLSDPSSVALLSYLYGEIKAKNARPLAPMPTGMFDPATLLPP